MDGVFVDSGTILIVSPLTDYHPTNYSSKPGCNLHRSQQFSPCQVTEVRVDGAADDLAADAAELLGPVAEGHDLSGTYEGEVQGVEEEDHVLA